MVTEISRGNYYNIPVPVYYIESDAETADLPTDTVPAIAIVNQSGNFHSLMLDSTGTWNAM